MAAAPQIFGVSGDAPDPSAIAEAARILRNGGLVAFPTETVYGLAADATNPKAIERLNQVKGRPPEKPYSLHLHAASQMAPMVGTIPPLAEQLIRRFWPGPLTIVMAAKDGTTLGFRLPNHPVAHAFLEACGVPVVAPSANHSGSPPPTDAKEVIAALGDAFDCLLDGGPTPMGRESTVVHVVNDRVDVLREGVIATDTILAAVTQAS